MNHDHHDHSDIGCLEAIEGLYALLDGEISDPRTVEQIETHVAHCRSCFSRAQVEQIITEKISQLEQVAVVFRNGDFLIEVKAGINDHHGRHQLCD